MRAPRPTALHNTRSTTTGCLDAASTSDASRRTRSARTSRTTLVASARSSTSGSWPASASSSTRSLRCVLVCPSPACVGLPGGAGPALATPGRIFPAAPRDSEADLRPAHRPQDAEQAVAEFGGKDFMGERCVPLDAKPRAGTARGASRNADAIPARRPPGSSSSSPSRPATSTRTELRSFLSLV